MEGHCIELKLHSTEEVPSTRQGEDNIETFTTQPNETIEPSQMDMSEFVGEESDMSEEDLMAANSESEILRRITNELTST